MLGDVARVAYPKAEQGLARHSPAFRVWVRYGPAEGGCGAAEIASLGKERAEVVSASRMPTGVGSPIGRFGALQVTLLLEQQTQVRGCGAIAGLVRTAKCCHRTREIASLGEQRAEVVSASRMPTGVRSPIGRFGALKITLLLKQQTEIRRSRAMAAVVGEAKCCDCRREIASFRE